MAKMTVQELKHTISKTIREMGLNETLSQDVLNKIKDNIVTKINGKTIETPTSGILSVVHENSSGPVMPGGTREFPREEEVAAALNQTDPNAGKYGMEPGGETLLDREFEPITTIPELPNMIDNIEPGKVVVFDYNEVAAEGGENLANKPLRMYDDPDIKRSIKDMWKGEGRKKVEVYVAKFEKIGEVEYDHVQSTAKFTEHSVEPEIKDVEKTLYQDLPGITPEVDNISSQIMNKNGWETGPSPSLRPNQQHSQMVKPMEENAKPTKMKELAGVETVYDKINTPSLIKESMLGNKKSGVSLISESEEVQTWELDGKIYHTPKKFITTTKCYIKN